MAWKDFGEASALERDVLRRAFPTLASTGLSRRATLEVGQPLQIDILVTETIGATPQGCVELLNLRPLLIGASWKVLDLLLEEALAQVPGKPNQPKKGYSIEFKQRQARAASARPALFEACVWAPLMGSYDATVEIRHSLVHRRVHTDPAGSLVGVDRAGKPLRPMSPKEQEAFSRLALDAADHVLPKVANDRSERRLLRHLADLEALHGHVVRSSEIPDVVPELKVIVHPDPADPRRYLLDVPDVRARNPFSAGGDCADLIVVPKDRPGQELRGWLEDAPHNMVAIDPHAPPAWLR